MNNKDTLLSFTDKDSFPAWASNFIALAVQENLALVKINNSLDGSTSYTRGGVAVILCKSHQIMLLIGNLNTI